MKSDSNITCEELQKRFDPLELTASNLSEIEQKLIQDHTATCPDCERLLKDWEVITKSAREMPQLEVPESVLKNIMSSVQSTTKVAIKEKTVKTDIIWLIGGFSALLLASSCLGADSLEGIASWSVSLAAALLIHHFLGSGKLKEAVRL
jgi:hypothetical protein